MGADYVEEYKWRFKMPIPKATMLAMDKLVAEGKWLKLKNGAYFMPIRAEVFHHKEFTSIPNNE